MKTLPFVTVLAAAAFAGCAALTGTPDEPVTAIVGATVIHPDRDAAHAVVRDETIVVAGSRIRAVGPAATTPVPWGAKVIDAKGKWVIPGMVDAHVHFFQSGNLYTRPDGADFGQWMPYAREDARNRARLPATFKVWLASGVTSVVDIGGPMWNFDMRDKALATEAAPRVAVAGPLVSMVEDKPLDLGDPPIVMTSSPQEARALVAKELARKPDYIKVWFIFKTKEDLPRQEVIVKAAGDAAHAAGVPLAVHATELATAKAAMRAGADYLVHSVDDEPIDDEFLALARKNHILYCPTLFVTNGYEYMYSGTWKATEPERRLADPQVLAMMDDLRKIPPEYIPERLRKRMANPKPVQPGQVMLDNLRRVWDAGIPVAMGTDAGNVGTLHGPSVFREMDYMLRAGLTPLQVLRSATTNGALAMRMERDLGAIEAGRLADLVVLDADPLADIWNASRASLVMKGGTAFIPSELMKSLDAPGSAPSRP
ncbi:MAG TPA: amidohydrolase family protein [Usitatibacter sp.]|nr:amidohydrolase family protein [Usitatibacter sp.]